MRKRETRHRDQRWPGQKESPHMSHSPVGPTAQGGFASTPYLIILLRQTLGERGWNIQRLNLAMGWDQEFRVKVAELAVELRLIAQPLIKAWPVPPPATADILIFPVSPRPRSES
jgi:hypothetical protein